MADRIRTGIVGYGNLGRGAELALGLCEDMELCGIFTRRDPAALRPAHAGTAVHPLAALADFEDSIDVLILCGGSRDDLPQQGPELAARFNTVDSFDTHARVPEYFDTMDAAARDSGKAAVISIGWDPGLFSLNRMLGEAILPEGETYSFWGKGLSQGHSDAVRRVEGVRAGVQYTLPSEQAMARVRAGDRPALATRDKHKRECYVVLEEGADAQAVEHAIVNMPHYFVDYDTTVHFVSEQELAANHAAMPHGGFVIHGGNTASGTDQTMEFALKLGSNPEFTASVLVAYARAACKLNRQGRSGAFTILGVPPGLLSPKSAAQLRGELI